MATQTQGGPAAAPDGPRRTEVSVVLLAAGARCLTVQRTPEVDALLATTRESRTMPEQMTDGMITLSNVGVPATVGCPR